MKKFNKKFDYSSIVTKKYLDEFIQKNNGDEYYLDKFKSQLTPTDDPNIFKHYNMDEEVVELCDVINSLPGITTVDSCSGHGKDSVNIFFEVDDTFEGLFFLTRCVDRRYWKYGHLWKIELSVGDTYKNKHLPISFLLHSGHIKGEEAYKQIKDLIKNMIYHLNHENFIKGFELDISKFELE